MLAVCSYSLHVRLLAAIRRLNTAEYEHVVRLLATAPGHDDAKLPSYDVIMMPCVRFLY